MHVQASGRGQILIFGLRPHFLNLTDCLSAGIVSTFSAVHDAAVMILFSGGLAQLAERLNGIQEVVGSTPISSTIA